MYYGIATPFRKGPYGYPELAEDYDKIDQAISVILNTGIGERVMRPAFGSRIYEFIFQPSDIVAVLGAEEINRALRIWEPRIQVVSVNASINENTVEFDIDYTMKTEKERRNKKVIFRKPEFPTV